jgi:8-oxo-dGTP diphosphatase
VAQPVLVCNVVIEKDGRYLLVQEGQAVAYKLWNLPGGHVDGGETLKQTAAREAREETGYSVVILRQLLVFKKLENGPILHAYSAKITSGELRFPPDEILDAKWFSYEEIMSMENLRDQEYIVAAIKAAQR